jgi:hypothetical protein
MHTEPEKTTEDAGRESARLSLWTAFTWFLTRPSIVQVLFWFLVILALKHANLFEPPVWDSAMGVFPPAIYLYENNFDIFALLQQTSWLEGGPNVHSLSLLTWILAGVMKMTGSPQVTFMIIHLLTFGVFAWTLAGFTWVLRSYGLAAHTVIAAALFLLLIPMVLVQVGSMYTETLVLCTSVGAWACWRNGRLGLAVLLCVIGIFLKLTAVAMAAVVGVALLFSGRPYNIRKILLILAIPFALWVNLSLPGWLGATPQAMKNWGEWEKLLFNFRARMQGVPDVLWVIRIGLLCGVAYLIARAWKDRGFRVITCIKPDSRSRLICVAMPFVFMGGVLAMIYNKNLFLDRYLLPVFPFAIGSTLLFASQVRGELVAFVVLIGGCVYSASNYNGRFYSPAYASFSIVERSHAYRDFHFVQVEAIKFLARKPDKIPAYVSREIDYMISHPMMGYVDTPLLNVLPMYVSPQKELTLDELPDEYILLRTNNGHGGSEMDALVLKSRGMVNYDVTERVIERNGFKAHLYTVKRISPDAS